MVDCRLTCRSLNWCSFELFNRLLSFLAFKFAVISISQANYGWLYQKTGKCVNLILHLLFFINCVVTDVGKLHGLAARGREGGGDFEGDEL